MRNSIKYGLIAPLPTAMIASNIEAGRAFFSYNRFLKLSCVALHTDEKDPYGAVRLARYLKRIAELALNDDEIFLASC